MSACSWRRPTTAGSSRPDMSPFTRPFRASIVARARFIEDLVAEQAARGVGQYVILGAGLDTFAQRRPELASRLRVFEVDQPGPQAWKRQRLDRARLRRPAVPAARAGRLRGRRRVVGAAGGRGLRRRPAGGRRLHRRQHVPDARTRSRPRCARSRRSPRARRSPCRSCCRSRWPTPRCARASSERRGRARQRHALHQLLHAGGDARAGPRGRLQRRSSTSRPPTLAQRYFAGRTDGLRPPDNSEELLVATT